MFDSLTSPRGLWYSGCTVGMNSQNRKRRGEQMSTTIVVGELVAIHPFERVRGDRHAFTVTLTDADGAAIPIADNTFRLSGSEHRNPTSSQPPVFTFNGTIVTDGSGGAAAVVSFAPFAADVDRTGVLFYDLEMKTAAGVPQTLARGTFTFVADVTGDESFLWTPAGGTVGAELDNDGSGFWRYKITNATVAEQALVHRERDGVPVVANEGTKRNFDISMSPIGVASPRQAFGPAGVWDFFIKWYGVNWNFELEFYSGQNSDEMIAQFYTSGEYGRFQLYGAVYPQGRGYTEYISESDDQALPEGWYAARWRVDFFNSQLSARFWNPAGAEPATWNCQGAVNIPFWGTLAPLWLVIDCDQTSGIFDLAEFGWSRVA